MFEIIVGIVIGVVMLMLLAKLNILALIQRIIDDKVLEFELSYVQKLIEIAYITAFKTDRDVKPVINDLYEYFELKKVGKADASDLRKLIKKHS